MPLRLLPVLFILTGLLTGSVLSGASIEPVSTTEVVSKADAIAIVEVTNISCYETIDGKIRTQGLLRVIESIKGDLPDYLYASQPGGITQDEADYQSLYPFLTGHPRALVMLKTSDYGPEFLHLPHGVLGLHDGHEEHVPTSAELRAAELLAEIQACLSDSPQDGGDFTEFAVTKLPRVRLNSTGFLGDTNPRRYLSIDRGGFIPVIYDASQRPPGITEEQCLEALQEAIAAWEAACSIDLEIVGTEVFPLPANQMARRFNPENGEGNPNFEADETIYVQFHDDFDSIDNGDNVLGIGGPTFPVNNGIPLGGSVNGLEFNRVNRGFVILDHEKTSNQNLAKFKAVLTHELGHALGLAHSSNTPGETDDYLADATMYFQIANDNRGASIRQYDADTIAVAYPTDNTPPYGYDRFLKLVTAFAPIQNDSVNRYRLAYGDLDGDEVTLEIFSDFTTDDFTSELTDDDTYLEITPNVAYSDGSSDPPSAFIGYSMYVQVSDGQYKSGAMKIGVSELFLDRRPNGAPDGLPDSWMIEHFGQDTPGANMGPDEDFDGDGQTNVQEFLGDTDPTDANDYFKLASFENNQISWAGQQFLTVELLESSDLESFTHLRYLQIPDDGSDEYVEIPSSEEDRAFYQIRRVD